MTQGDDSAASLTLSDQLLRARHRAARLKRKIGSGEQAWQRWSTAMDEAAQIVDRIASTPANNVADLAIKFAAMLWAIEANESLLDSADAGRLRAFGRELQRLARH